MSLKKKIDIKFYNFSCALMTFFGYRVRGSERKRERGGKFEMDSRERHKKERIGGLVGCAEREFFGDPQE